MTVLLSDVITGTDGAPRRNGEGETQRTTGAHAAQFRITGLTRLLRPRAAARGRHVLTAAECREQVRPLTEAAAPASR